MVAILGDFGRLMNCHRLGVAGEHGDDLILFLIELLSQSMGIGRHMKAIADDKTSAVKDRWRPTGFLKRADGHDGRFDLTDDVGKPAGFAGKCTIERK